MQDAILHVTRNENNKKGENNVPQAKQSLGMTRVFVG